MGAFAPTSSSSYPPTMAKQGNQVGNASLMTEASMLAAMNARNFSSIYHLGVLVDGDTPVWGDRSLSVSIKQISFGTDNVFNDDRVEANVGIGTHLDGLGHIEHKGVYYGEHATDHVFHPAGLLRLGLAENVPFFIAPFKMLDMAAYLRQSVVPADTEYSQEDIEGAMEKQDIIFEAGDVILLRSGWTYYLDKSDAFNRSGPGPGLAAATFLANKNPILIASDTAALEVYDQDVGTDFPVHKLLLCDRGIYIGEIFNLEELASNSVTKGTIIIPITQTRGLCQSRVNPIVLA